MADEPAPTNGALLARIDERTQNTADDVAEINRKLDKKYVTKDQFEPVKKVVYGLVGAALLSVAAGVLALVIQ